MAGLGEIMAMNPRKKGESQWAYQQRIGSLGFNQQGTQGITAIPGSLKAPQGATEPDLISSIRQGLGGVMDTANSLPARLFPDVQYMRDVGRPFGNAVVQAFSAAADTPQARQERKAAAVKAPQAAAAFSGGGMPGNSYKDPRWGALEADAEKAAGLPAGALALIRTKGERSNMDQISSAGARSVYQITPTTAALIQKKYGFDPMSSPQNMARGAALVLKEGIDRTGNLEGGVRQYIGGTNPANYGQTTADYVARVMGGVSEAGGLASGFDPSYGNAAMGVLQAGQQAAMAPQSFEMDVSGRPEMPTPEMEKPVDFSKVDAALEKLKPHELEEKEQLEIRRNGWFKGLGQALMQLEDGAGLGKVLAAVGGGAMAGVGRANDEVRARKDKFDEDMVKYNSAIANNEMTKANSLAQTMQHNVQTSNSWALTKFKQDLDVFNQEHDLTVQGDSVITTRRSGDKLITTRTPIAGAVAAAFAPRMANVLESQGSQQNAALGNRAQMYNTMLISAAGQQAAMSYQTDPEAAAGGAVLGTAALATDVVASGRVSSLFQGKEEAFKELQKDVVTSLGQMGLREGTTGYPEAYQRAMAERITAASLSNPKFRDSLFQVGGAAAAVRRAGQVDEQKRTTTTGPRGTTTRTESK